MLSLGIGLRKGGDKVSSVGGCSDLYAEGDFADPCNETNTNGGAWTTAGTGTLNLISESDGEGGSYSMEITCGTFGNGGVLTLPALTNGATYTIETRAKNSGSNSYAYILGGFTTTGVLASHNTTSYTNGEKTGLISNGAAVLIRWTSDVVSTTMTVARVKITKTADP